MKWYWEFATLTFEVIFRICHSHPSPINGVWNTTLSKYSDSTLWFIRIFLSLLKWTSLKGFCPSQWNLFIFNVKVYLQSLRDLDPGAWGYIDYATTSTTLKSTQYHALNICDPSGGDWRRMWEKVGGGSTWYLRSISNVFFAKLVWCIQRKLLKS